MKRLLRWAAVLLALVLLVGGAAAWLGWRWLQQPYQGYSGEQTVQVASGTGAGQILAQLEAAGVLEDARPTRLYLIHVLGDPALKAGEYRFEQPLTPPQVLDKLIQGEVITHPVTLIEGRTLYEVAETLAQAGFGELDTFLAEMRNPTRIADLDPEADDLEGYLFPDTYRFARGTSEAAIVDTLVRTFRDRYLEEVEPLMDERDSDLNLNLRRLMTLASIIEKEAQLDEERPVISGVYTNRLRRGMLLQADPTVIYGLVRLGTYDGNLRRPDLRVDSPYNTYRYPGLPPGPIASPGLSSLLAAAQPADVPYYYFVSRNDGSHVFARTLREHNRNVDEWQKRYWRQRWAEERQRRQP